MTSDPVADQDTLVRLVRQLRLDHLAVSVSRHLTEAAVPHALIKGPTTSLWLYDPPRDYRDVDLLVPWSRLDDATEVLVAGGVVGREHTAPGEVAAHSLLLTAVDGAEVDLHVALPGMAGPRDDALWNALAGHVVPFELGGHRVPALDLPARCLVLAMHAVMAGPHDRQPWEDLRRARLVTGGDVWDETGRTAVTVGLDRHVLAAVALLDGRSVNGVAPEIDLLLRGASGSAVQLERLTRLHPREKWRLMRRELFPSRSFVSAQFPALAGARFAYARGWWRRSKALVAGLRGAVGEVRQARRNARLHGLSNGANGG